MPSFDDHADNLLSLLEIEREAEKEENKRELERYPLHVREALGKTVTRLQIDDEDVGTGGLPVIILSRVASAPKKTSSKSKPPSTVDSEPAVTLSPFHAMNQGDNVRLSYPAESKLPPVDGTLYDVGELRVTVAINGRTPNPLPHGLCQLDMLGSDATYKRMRQALNLVKRTEKPELLRLRDIFMGEREPDFDRRPKLTLHNQKLNPFQVEAVEKCLAAEDVALIHGPPGTGKTTVLVEVILQAVKRGEKVLASAPSNIAVDNMVEKLLSSGVRIVRLGHPARILESIHHVTLSALEEESEEQAEIWKMNDERHRLLTQLRRKEERGHGLDYHAKRELQREIEDLGRKARDHEFMIRRRILQDAQVILATHAGVTDMLKKNRFDTIVMDEASQATEPLSWIPITFGKKVVFAGDHCQLPPTIYSKDAAKRGLATTLFDNLKKSLPDELQTMLRVQYRMHEDIMTFSSTHFYGGKLQADESVREHTASELPNVKASALTESPVTYIDTAGTGYAETWNELLESRENEGEVRLAMLVLDQLMYHGLKPSQVAIITPYVAQVKKLRLASTQKGVEIGSVDSFQGREKEVVIVSLVRSNESGEVGFLEDTRRMNVALTRARRLLVVIGDSATISQHSFYRDFIDYVDKLDAHQSAWEWTKV